MAGNHGDDSKESTQLARRDGGREEETDMVAIVRYGRSCFLFGPTTPFPGRYEKECHPRAGHPMIVLITTTTCYSKTMTVSKKGSDLGWFEGEKQHRSTYTNHLLLSLSS
jgi:hypothetical protein